MKRTPLNRDAIRFQFVGFGERAEPDLEKKDRLYLDVGNDLRPGVIDHHHLAAYSGSTTSLVLAHPDLIEDAVDPARRDNDPFTLVLHVNPDLDCIASAYLTIAYLTSGAFPDGAETLARYVTRVDEGYVGTTLENPFTLYAAYMLLVHRFAQRTWKKQEDMWRESVKDGLEVVEFVVAEAAREGLSLLEVDAIKCPGLFGHRDREEIQQDVLRYRRKLADPRTKARQLKLRLPGQLGGTVEVDALLIRDVQNAADPDRCIFFKDWARSDREASAGKNGFAALSVFMSESATGARRCILSVKPESGICLRSLGKLLDEAEAEERRQIHGVDDRVMDPATKTPRPSRPGYTNADPWYDGRAHGYTIVDAPRSGTVLSADTIEEIFIRFGRRADALVEPLVIPSPVLESATPAGAEETLRHLSLVVEAGLAARKDTAPVEALDIFISYPRKRLDWVKEQIYQPLQSWGRGKNIFFDMHSLHAGVGWLTTLADGVARSRIFLPVYCPEYFRSDFCQWELQLAMIRDPLGRKGIIVPVLLEQMSLPPYCALIQAIDASAERFGDELRRILEQNLG